MQIIYHIYKESVKNLIIKSFVILLSYLHPFQQFSKLSSSWYNIYWISTLFLIFINILRDLSTILNIYFINYLSNLIRWTHYILLNFRIISSNVSTFYEIYKRSLRLTNAANIEYWSQTKRNCPIQQNYEQRLCSRR